MKLKFKSGGRVLLDKGIFMSLSSITLLMVVVGFVEFITKGSMVFTIHLIIVSSIIMPLTFFVFGFLNKKEIQKTKELEQHKETFFEKIKK